MLPMIDRYTENAAAQTRFMANPCLCQGEHPTLHTAAPAGDAQSFDGRLLRDFAVQSEAALVACCAISSPPSNYRLLRRASGL
jgi:hypothetical protein